MKGESPRRSPNKVLTKERTGDTLPPMRILLFTVVALFLQTGYASAAGGEGIEIKLCGAFERPGTYSVNRTSVHVQDIVDAERPSLLARRDILLIVDASGQRIVDLSSRDESSLLRGGEQLYLFERIIDRKSR